MKSYISKFFMGAALVCTAALGSCVGDLDQFPKDPTKIDPTKFKEDPREYIGGALGKCYSSIAVSGQNGAGSSDISGLDNGRSCWSRAIFMLNEFTTDECQWIWADSGVYDLVTSTWSDTNENIFGTYSRLYTHIAVCNEFIRLLENSGDYGITFPETATGNQVSAKDARQFSNEARALRDLSYFYVIDLFGNAALAWDTDPAGTNPVPTTRAALYQKVTADLEYLLTPEAGWEDSNIYGRINKDAVEALLVKFYLNCKEFAGTNDYAKCLSHAENIINRHKGGGFQDSGLANDYLSLFCANNDLFGPGGALRDQQENIWTIPYEFRMTESYGGTSFLIFAALTDKSTATPGWFGSTEQWTCMHARTQFSQTFGFQNGVSADGRTYLWSTDNQGFTIDNTDFSTFKDGYVPIKFTNVKCDPATGLMPRWNDPATGLPRCGVADLTNEDNYGIETMSFVDTDLPVIRLAEIYLSAAEAILRMNGDTETAKKYVNYIRERAGVAPYTVAQMNLDNILAERGRELYWENCRRTDLIRFGKFTSGYNWNWKNNAPYGAPIADHMKLFPIPSQVLTSYPAGAYPQNENY